EMGAKAGIVDPAGLTLPYDFTPVLPAEDAHYIKTFEFDVSNLEPQVSVPGSPDQVRDIKQFVGTKIDYAFIGTCTNGRLEDLRTAADILRGRQLAEGVRLVIAPASRSVLLDAVTDGSLEALVRAGASIINPGCGPCVGTHQGVPGNDEVVISAANRNFTGRMGNPKAQIYLGSPATVAAAALSGEIIHPRMVGYGSK
ncbi:MAG: aconitase family protein, partial [Bacteroidota bacterium]